VRKSKKPTRSKSCLAGAASESTRIVVVSDLHVNSTVGLFPPNFVRDDGASVSQNKFQAWLWRCWTDFCQHAHQFNKFVPVINGDAIQGIHPSRDIQIVLPSDTDMLRAAVAVIQPLIQGAQAVYLVRGTEWHDGTGGKDSEKLAQMLGAYVDPNIQQHSHWTLNLELSGKRFAFAHHTAVTTVYHGTPPAREWREAKEQQVDDGVPVPDVIVRSHVHRWGFFPDSTGRLYFTTPGWQLKNAFGFKKRPLYLPSIGGLILWVENGIVQFQKHLYQIPQSQSIRISP